MRTMTPNRRRLYLGVFVVLVAAYAAYSFWMVAAPGERVSISTQPAPTTTMPVPRSTTLDPTQPTITVYMFGQKQVIPLPPGVPDPASVPPGSEGVVNCHVPVGGSGTVPPEVFRGPEPHPLCKELAVPGNLSPEAQAAIAKFFPNLGTTTTTGP